MIIEILIYLAGFMSGLIVRDVLGRAIEPRPFIALSITCIWIVYMVAQAFNPSFIIPIYLWALMALVAGNYFKWEDMVELIFGRRR